MASSIPPSKDNAFKVLVTYWPLLVALFIGAGILSEARYRLADLENKFVQLEKRSDDRFNTISAEMKEDHLYSKYLS